MSPPPSTFSTPASISSGSIPDMNPTFPRFIPRSTRPGYILEALSIVPSPTRTNTRSGSVSPSGSSDGLTSEISTALFSRAATSLSRYPSLTPGFATMPTLRTSIRSATDYLPDERLLKRRLFSTHQVKRVLSVPRPPSCNLRAGKASGPKSKGCEEPGDAQDHSLVDLGISHQPSAADEIWPRLELRFDEQNRLLDRGSGGEEPLQSYGKGDK